MSRSNEWTVLACPHCGNYSPVEMNSKRICWVDTHKVRKPFGELHKNEFERNYHCDKCNKHFYVTFVRKPKPFKAFQEINEYGIKRQPNIDADEAKAVVTV